MKKGRILLAIALISVMACAMANVKKPAVKKSQIVRVDSTDVDSAKSDTGAVTFHKIVNEAHTQMDTVGSKVGKVAKQVGADSKEAWGTAKEGTKKAAKAVKDFFTK